jgi:hypothetical protein
MTDLFQPRISSTLTLNTPHYPTRILPNTRKTPILRTYCNRFNWLTVPSLRQRDSPRSPIFLSISPQTPHSKSSLHLARPTQKPRGPSL